MFLEMPTYTFEEAIIKTSRIHNLLIQYPDNKYFSALESFWKWKQDTFKNKIIMINSVHN
jgi:hypothetical protein